MLCVNVCFPNSQNAEWSLHIITYIDDQKLSSVIINHSYLPKLVAWAVTDQIMDKMHICQYFSISEFPNGIELWLYI